jgi:hypothetical protein
LETKTENLSLKTRALIGILNGFFFGASMAVFDYLDDVPFSIYQFLFYFVSFGFLMTIVFRHKHTKVKK